MENRKYILVTGGAGYIGSHTVVELIRSGYIPVILDDFRNAERNVKERLEQITGQPILMIDAACQDTDKLRAVFSQYKFQGVVHFAADKAVGESVQDPLKYYDNNFNSLISVLRMMQEFGTRSLVFSSSCTVYGNPRNGTGHTEVTEASPLFQPESPYGYTKLVAEQIIRDWIAVNPVNNVILLRYFNPAGAHPSGLIGELPQGIPNNLLPYITQTALGIREKLTVFGSDYETADGTCVRDFIHVCDLADAHVKALDWLEKQEGGCLEVFNIGTGTGTSVLEIIHAFESVTGVPLNWEFGARRKGDVAEIYANVAKALEILGWHAKFTVEDAIRDAWHWENKRIAHV